MKLKDKIQKQAKPYISTLVIFGFEVYQLIGVHEDEEDVYYITHSRRGIVYQSCLCGFIPLKGFLKRKDYSELVRIWNLNTVHWNELKNPVKAI